MIRYAITRTELRACVKQRVPGWTARARKRTAGFRKTRRYEEKSSIWGEVKPVFMELQNGKCCFCEKKYESGQLGRYELDIEHFRPKGTVKRCPQHLVGKGLQFTAPAAKNSGYYILAYNLFNYAAACKPCNSGLKSNYFPIAGTYQLNGDNPAKMKAEKAWLIYPIGSMDIDPERVISFRGIWPRSVHRNPSLQKRGVATIAFFQLDDVVERKNLLRERATLLVMLHGQLVQGQEPKAVAFVNNMLASGSPHTNCARSFERLFRANQTEAAAVADEARDFLISRS